MALTKVSPDLLDLDAGITITTTDNSDNLTLTSTDADANAGPNLRMYRNSGSPADNDYIGEIQFEGRNDNSQDVIYAGLAARILDASDGTEDGRFELFTIRNGSQISTMVTTATETVFNEDSIDHDFRVESDGNANMLIVDADTNRVGIGTSSPANNLHIFTDAGDEGLTIKSTGNTSNAIIFDANRSGAGSSIGEMQSKWNGTTVAMIASVTGSDTTNKDDGLLAFYTSSANDIAEKMRLTSDGKLGIGETSPDSLLHIKNTTADGVAGISLENDARRYAINVHGGLSDGLAIYNAGAGETQFFISSAGNVGIGADNTSPDSILSIKDASSDPILTVHKNATGANDAMRVQHGRGLSGFTGKGITFRRNDGTEVGNVTIGFSSTAFNTSSDYRLKENITYTWDATTRLKQLKPARFTFKDDTSDVVDGFLAHEVSSIVPKAVDGEKDAVDSEGNPEYQSIDQSKLVPLLVKTIQELEARITALES
jgi:hypothetical protein